jgi:tetratricopeptide (TPR) repeat protein
MANLFLRLHRDEAAANAYERVLRIRPDDPQAQFHRAWCLLHVPKRRGEGITAFQELLRVSPSAAGFFLMGCGLQHESRHEEAVEAFREAARLENPGTADLHYNYAISLTALRRLEEAADAYQNAAHLNPSDGEAWGNLGAAFAELGRWKDAAPCQERAMRLARSLTHGLNLGSTLYELNRLEEAERVLREALVHDPRSIDAMELLVQVLAGQDRYDEAIKLAREVCTLNPDAPSSRVVLAGALAEAGRLGEAHKEAKAVANLAPSDPRPHSALGAIYVRMNDGTAALAAFEQMARCLDATMEQLPSSALVWCHAGRGSAFSLLGRHDDAMAAFEEVLRTDQGFFERWPEVAPHYQLSSRETDRNKQSSGS